MLKNFLSFFKGVCEISDWAKGATVTGYDVTVQGLCSSGSPPQGLKQLGREESYFNLPREC